VSRLLLSARAQITDGHAYRSRGGAVARQQRSARPKGIGRLRTAQNARALVRDVRGCEGVMGLPPPSPHRVFCFADQRQCGVNAVSRP
jgi:hypothetical protein